MGPLSRCRARRTPKRRSSSSTWPGSALAGSNELFASVEARRSYSIPETYVPYELALTRQPVNCTRARHLLRASSTSMPVLRLRANSIQPAESSVLRRWIRRRGFERAVVPTDPLSAPPPTYALEPGTLSASYAPARPASALPFRDAPPNPNARFMFVFVFGVVRN